MNMGAHYETIEISGVDWVAPRGEIGDDVVPGGKYALSFSNGDGGVFAIGTAEQVVEFARQVNVAANQVQADAAGPLTYHDFEFDGDDQMYYCPRCEAGIEPGEHGSLFHLQAAIDAHIETHRPEHQRG